MIVGTFRLLARRYARALFEWVSRSGGDHEGVLSYLREIKEIWSQYPVIRFLDQTWFPGEQRSTLLQVFNQYFSSDPHMLSLFRLLIEKRRFFLLPFLEEVYRELVEEEKGIVRGVVKTSHTFTEEEKRVVQRFLEKELGKKVELEIVEDPSLWWGFRIQVGSRLWEGSIRERMNLLRKRMVLLEG
jgi:F-type H+-transporting ATPase subunit delta